MPLPKRLKRRPPQMPPVLDLSIDPGPCALGANQGENWCAKHGANWLIGQDVCDGMRARAKKIATGR